MNKILLLFSLTIAISYQLLPNCDTFRYGGFFPRTFYGECEKCYKYSFLITPGSYKTDCLNNRFVLYTNGDCNSSFINSYEPFDSVFPKCNQKKCCLFFIKNDILNNNLGAIFVENCDLDCFGSDIASTYFKYYNDSFYSYHQTNDCVDNVEKKRAIKICETVENVNNTTKTIADLTTKSQNSTTPTSNESSSEDLILIFCLMAVIVLVII